MKKILFFGLMATLLGLASCSNEEESLGKNTGKDMVLRATVEQSAGIRATIDDKEATWKFDFTESDNISVTNTAISIYYTFTKSGDFFQSDEAETTESNETWYAYFPSNEISLVGQSGTKEDVANKYALAGATASATTGKGGLSIVMDPKVAILVIDNQVGTININVKNSATTWVKGLKANGTGFDVTTESTQQNLLSTTTTGKYYIAVPAGVQLSIKNGNNVIKSTNTSGLTAGKYYNLTIAPATTGTAKRSGDIDVKWIQLWKNGPKFAEYNVGAANSKAEDYGGYYAWGGNQDKVDDHNTGSADLTGDNDTAIKLWGSNWRMPTQAELVALLNNCDVKWTTQNSVNGFLCTGKGDYSSNSVFLPAAGYYDGSVGKRGERGYYWSSMPDGSESAYRLYFTSSSNDVESRGRNYGYSVRAVLNEQK